MYDDEGGYEDYYDDLEEMGQREAWEDSRAEMYCDCGEPDCPECSPEEDDEEDYDEDFQMGYDYPDEPHGGDYFRERD